jgi:hypothetical protein
MMRDLTALIGVFALIRCCVLNITERSNFAIIDSTCISNPFEFLSMFTEPTAYHQGYRTGSTSHTHHHSFEVTTWWLILRGIAHTIANKGSYAHNYISTSHVLQHLTQTGKLSSDDNAIASEEFIHCETRWRCSAVEHYLLGYFHWGIKDGCLFGLTATRYN